MAMMMKMVNFNPFEEGNKGVFEVGFRSDGLRNLWRIAPVEAESDGENAVMMVMRWVVAHVFDPNCHEWNPSKACLEEVR